jgi:hypothetical protein
LLLSRDQGGVFFDEVGIARIHVAYPLDLRLRFGFYFSQLYCSIDAPRWRGGGWVVKDRSVVVVDFDFFGLERFQEFNVYSEGLTVSPADLPFEGRSHDWALDARALHFCDVDERSLAIPGIGL